MSLTKAKGQLTPQSMPICPFISLTPHFMVHWHCMSESLSQSQSNCTRLYCTEAKLYKRTKSRPSPPAHEFIESEQHHFGSCYLQNFCNLHTESFQYEVIFSQKNVCKIFSLCRGIEPRSPAWQAGILTTILTKIDGKKGEIFWENSVLAEFFIFDRLRM